MAFCTKCGRKLEDGEICTCDSIQKDIAEQVFNPYEEPSNKDKTVSVDEKNVVINIDTDKVKKGVSDAVKKISGEVEKGVDKLNEHKENYNTSDAFEYGLKIVPECISANDGEVPIKQYNFAKLRSRLTFEKAQGRLQVTNKRVIFRAAGRSLMGRNVLHQEFRIDELAGVEVRHKHEFNVLSLIIGIILTGVFGGVVGFALTNYWYIRTYFDGGITPTFFSVVFALASLVFCGFLTYRCHSYNSDNKLYGLRQILLSIASGSLLAEVIRSGNGFIVFCLAITGIACVINLFLYSISENLVAIFKTGASAAIEIKREPISGLLSFLFAAKDDTNSGYQEILPWTDTDIAIRELGTMIDDIKTMGDAAIDKWKVE